jgi:hypothetical protein
VREARDPKRRFDHDHGLYGALVRSFLVFQYMLSVRICLIVSKLFVCEGLGWIPFEMGSKDAYV